MVSKKDLLADIDFLSDRISTQVRTIALSVIAVVWLFAVGGKDTPALPTIPDQTLLLAGGGLSLFALVADYLQYLMGYLDNKRALRVGERENREEFLYDYTALTWKTRTYFFWGKQILVIGGFGSLAFSIGCALFP
jgi:hypothetical protein